MRSIAVVASMADRSTLHGCPWSRAPGQRWPTHCGPRSNGFGRHRAAFDAHLHELQRRHHHRRGAVAPGLLWREGAAAALHVRRHLPIERRRERSTPMFGFLVRMVNRGGRAWPRPCADEQPPGFARELGRWGLASWEFGMGTTALLATSCAALLAAGCTTVVHHVAEKPAPEGGGIFVLRPSGSDASAGAVHAAGS